MGIARNFLSQSAMRRISRRFSVTQVRFCFFKTKRGFDLKVIPPRGKSATLTFHRVMSRDLRVKITDDLVSFWEGDSQMRQNFLLHLNAYVVDKAPTGRAVTFSSDGKVEVVDP